MRSFHWQNDARRLPGACLAGLIVLASAACGEPTTPAAPHRSTAHALAKNTRSRVIPIAVSMIGDNGQNIYLTDTTGTRFEQITFGGLDGSPAWSPDRRRIAFTRGDGGDQDIYVKSLSGGREKLIGHGITPAWSPDGTQIVFTRFDGPNADIYVMDADGGNVRRLTTDPAYDLLPHWAADGSSIVFASTRAGSMEIFRMTPDGGAVTQRTFCGPSYYCTSPKMSPIPGDARMLYYQGTNSNSGATPVSAIRAIDANGTVVIDLDGGLVRGQPTWSPDGDYYAFTGQGAGMLTPYVYTKSVTGPAFNWLLQPEGFVAESPAWAR